MGFNIGLAALSMLAKFSLEGAPQGHSVGQYHPQRSLQHQHQSSLCQANESGQMLQPPGLFGAFPSFVPMPAYYCDNGKDVEQNPTMTALSRRRKWPSTRKIMLELAATMKK
ncbi:hypothetical protein MMC31_000920 [Peltigera leucophlebia]|nr:hypothetical protein [Peltigera leucophlebia]